MQIKKQELEQDMEQTSSKLGKEYNKAVYSHPHNLYSAYNNLYADYIMQNAAGWIPRWNQDCQEKYQ